MSLRPVWVSILRKKREGDGAGGKTMTLSPLPKRYKATIYRQRKSSSEERLEDGTHGSPGPGLEEATRRVFSFRKPFPPLMKGDTLVADGGSEDKKQYTVHHPRPYDWTLQVDVEEVK